MSRQLRPRKSKPSYAVLAGFAEDEDGATTAGPSTLAAVVLDESDSGSDFSPDKDAEGVPEDEEMEDIEQEDGVAEAQLQEIAATPTPKPLPKDGKGKGKAVAKTKAKAKPAARASPRASVTPGAALPRTSRRQMHMLPTPSVHHRHRATALFARLGRVERLESQPALFGPVRVTPTNSFTHNMQITDRANKAWGYNVGSGPLWQMVEDRRWFKEAITTGDDADSEAKRRPRVYPDVPVKSGWKILDKSEGAIYLPTDNETTEDGSFKPPPPVPCYFGPIASQTRRQVEMLESFHMSEYLPESRAHVFNAGAPVWAIDWCPIHPDDRAARYYTQYVAVAPFPNSSHSPEIGVKVNRPSSSCLQIWSLFPTKPIQGEPSSSQEDAGRMKCEMVVCIDNGPALELKWCPLPSHDVSKSEDKPRKLGLLAGTFEDGSFCVYVIPEPADLVSTDSEESQPVFVRLPEPILRIELSETSCWSFDWANSERVAIGTTNGVIAVYDLGPSLKAFKHPDTPAVTNLRPTHYLTIHQSAIRALAWIQAPPCSPSGSPNLDEDPTVIASGGYDGVECLTDIREGRGSIMNRTRDVINTLVFSPFAAGPITMDHENTVKAYAASPSMLGRGHTLLEPLGPVWCISASEYHPQLAVAAADGSCSTTNTLRSPRRGGSVPFFVHKIYHMEYSRNAKEYRMLDCFLPQEVPDARSAVSNANKKAAPANGTGAWSREAGVHRVAWNNGNGLGSSCMLASATASGLCRIDVVWGRWIKDKLPYGGIENIRMESGGQGGAMDVDSELSDADSLSS